MIRRGFYLLLCGLLAGITAADSQTIPCRNTILLTRQNTGTTETFLSSVAFQSNGSVSIQNADTITSKYTNGSVYYNGYVWSHDWTGSQASGNFQLLKIGNNTVTSVTPSPTLASGSTFNNACVTAAGMMYLMSNLTLYSIDLTTATPSYLGTKTCTMSPIQNSSGHIWGDLAVDPTDGTIYAWYHPTTGTALPGLYTLTNVTGTTPSFQKVGSQTVGQTNTMGSLFFTDDGQLFAYGATTLGGTQDRLFIIDKTTGNVTQYGAPDIGVSQSDGCSCAFRLSLEKSSSVPSINLQRCATDTFKYYFKTRNYTGATVSSIIFRDTLDSRFYAATSAAALQTTLQAIYGGSVAVTIGNYGTGTNNLITATGLSIASGTQTFSIPVGLSADAFSASTVISAQAYLDNLSATLGGPKEASDNPTTYEPADATSLSINLSGSRCTPPVADNFTNLPINQGAGATAIPAPVGSDADGTIANYTIVTVPAGAYGTLSYCPNAPSACTSGQYLSISANTTLTPSQAATMRFDPASTATGTGSFTFTVTDNTGSVSQAATYRLPVTTAPPVANNIMESVMANTNGATAILPLTGADADEPTLQSFKILTIPAASEGVLYLCNPSCTAVTANQIIATADAGKLKFDPTGTFTGNSSFTYTDIDNSGNLGNTATYTIPVAAAASTARPPLANNITAQTLNNAWSSTAIPGLKGSDLDGWVTSYTILSTPSVSAGTLYLCNPTCTAVSTNQVIAPADAAKLQFDPLGTYTGTASFTYKATDNTSLASNVATYSIPISNNPPTAANMAYTVPYNASNAALPAISGSDKDGTIASYTITALPASGTLSLCNPTCGSVSANQTIAVADVAKLAYTPATNATGSFSFSYTSTDHNGNTSTAATYLLYVNNLAPVASDIINASLANTAAATTISALSATDADGSIASYTIRSLPPSASGTLSLSGIAVAVNDVLTTAQLANLQFDPAANYTGNTSFTYTATDNSGNISNVATVQIPVTGVGNLPPIAKSIQVSPIAVSASATNTTALSGTDPDGSIASYTIVDVPASLRGTMKYCPNAPSACTSGQMLAISANLSLTTSQATTLQFTPNSTYIGPFTFSYTTTDNVGAVSNLALYNIPVTGLNPRVTPVVATAMSNTAAATSIPSLSGTDPDGSVLYYVIENIPPATTGVLYLCTPSCAAVTAGQQIAAVDAGNLQFDPAASYFGDLVFNYHALDNHTLRSNSAKYTIPVKPDMPQSADVISGKLKNTLGSTAIPTLTATAPTGGSISSYVINSLPPAASGILYLCMPSCAAVTAGQVIPVANAGSLQFDPASGFTGDALFNYAATDATGTQGNISTYSMPVGSIVALPVTGLDIFASRTNDRRFADVQWHVETEQNCSHYELERSTDGLRFEQAAHIAAIGNSVQPVAYHYKDNIEALSAAVYYRVQQVDMDSRTIYSKVVSVTLPLRDGIDVSVTPNPFRGTLSGSIYTQQATEATLVLSDLSGSTLLHEALQLRAGGNTFSLPETATLVPGVYQLSIHAQGEAAYTIKLVRQ